MSHPEQLGGVKAGMRVRIGTLERKGATAGGSPTDFAS